MKINRRIHNHVSISVKANANFAKSILGLPKDFIFYGHLTITLVTVKTKNLKSVILMDLVSLMLLIIIIV